MLKKTLAYLMRKTAIRARVNWYLTKINYIRKILINDVEMRIPSIQGITCNPTEPWMINLLDKVLQEQCGAFLDVGVNVGQTLVKVKALDPQREYIGFEPNAVCVSYVQRLIKENSFEKVILFPVGLFTEDCILSLDLFSDNVADSSASLIANFRPDHKIDSQVLVPVFRFDSLVSLVKSKYIGIVKIDVEGAELEVTKSLLTLIRRDRPIILIEVLPVYSDKNTFRINRQNELEQIFIEVGYAVLRIDKTSTNTCSWLSRIETFGIHSDLTQCDYVVVPNEKLGKLQKVFDAPATDNIEQ